MNMNFKFGPWFIEYTPEDGARLDRLTFENYDLVTTKPSTFRKPSTDYGEYENRPVYGYDDCFPSIQSCLFPGMNWEIPDHGEICWLKWNYVKDNNSLTFLTKSEAIPVQFKREMIFNNSSITWNFEVYNEGKKKIPFQHVMHPLLKLDEIKSFDLPHCQSVFNRTTNQILDLKTPKEIRNYLINQPSTTANMLFLRQINEGKVSWTYNNGMIINVVFPKKLFPSIGVWWNNKGYPNEPGLVRNECAFEPIPGFTAALTDAYTEGNSLEVLPNDRFSWQILWHLSK